MKWLRDMVSFFRIPGAPPLIAGMFCYGIGLGILAPMNAVYMRDGIGLSKAEIASVFSIALLINMIVTLSVGVISDRIKRKKTLPLAACLSGMIGLAVYMGSDGYGLTLTGMILIVGPSGLIMGQLFAMARNHFMKKAADFFEMAQIWLRSTLSIGFFAGLLIGANVYLIADFRGILIGNFVGIACLFVLLLLYKEHGGTVAGGVSQGEPFSLLMLVALLLLSCGDALRGLYLPLVVVQLFGKPELMSYLWSVQAVFELLFMTLAGYWAAQYGSMRIIRIAALFAVVVYVVYTFSPSIAFFFTVQPLYSFYVSVLFGVAMGYVQRMFHTRIGFGSSLYVVLTQTASLVGYLLPFLVQGYSPSIFYIPAALVAAALTLMWIAARRERARPERKTLFR